MPPAGWSHFLAARSMYSLITSLHGFLIPAPTQFQSPSTVTKQGRTSGQQGKALLQGMR